LNQHLMERLQGHQERMQQQALQHAHQQAQQQAHIAQQVQHVHQTQQQQVYQQMQHTHQALQEAQTMQFLALQAQQATSAEKMARRLQDRVFWLLHDCVEICTEALK